MILLPAIDIRDGRAVRLVQGDFDRETVYADDPLEAARSWKDAGARALHVVDLDGARHGEPMGLEHLGRIVHELGLPVQYGGGLRTTAAVAGALTAGAERVVVGTAALTDSDLLDTLLERFGDRVAVAVDARDGRVAVAGWAETTGEGAEAVAGRLAERGVTRIVYTDVDRDGMLAGPALESLLAVGRAAGAATRIVYSGGVASLEDLRSLGSLGLPSLDAVVSGKALYERRFTVEEGQSALDEAGKS